MSAPRAAAFSCALTLIAAGPAPELPRLVDVTREAGISFVHSIGDDALDNIIESTGAGACFADLDGDGRLDVYLVNGAYLRGISHVRGRRLAGKLRNALYLNDGDGTFTDATERAGVGHTGFGMACLAADYDNDGDTDLYVTNYGPNVLYRNRGDGSFEDVTAQAGVQSDLFSTGCTFFDYDRDGDLDLFVGNYIEFDPDYRYFHIAQAFPGPLAYKGQPDVLFRNRGDGSFEDVTRQAGLFNPDGRAMGVSSADFDVDGDVDLFVANDAMENYFYRNDGDGRFTNVALETETAFGQNGDATSAMGPEFGDFDLDGLTDLLVPDMAYSCLYRNSGKGYFEEMSARMRVADACGQYTSWSGNFFDFDGDGYLDIFLANGDAHHLEPEEDLLLRNVEGKSFADISPQVGDDFQAKQVGRGSAIGDFDGDGDLDILVLNLNGPARLLRNDGGNRRHWLEIDVVGTQSNRDAIGTRIEVSAGGQTQTREVRSSSGYLSQSDYRQHFGLGSSAKASRVEVRWPSGEVQVLTDVPADQVLRLTEPAASSQG